MLYISHNKLEIVTAGVLYSRLSDDLKASAMFEGF
jgi:hypothetical protein